jgi:hypothetical protein
MFQTHVEKQKLVRLRRKNEMILEGTENNYFVSDANTFTIVEIPSKAPCLFSALA